MEKMVYMIAYGSDEIADYIVYEDKEEAEKVRIEKYSKFNTFILQLPFKDKQ